MFVRAELRQFSREVWCLHRPFIPFVSVGISRRSATGWGGVWGGGGAGGWVEEAKERSIRALASERHGEKRKVSLCSLAPHHQLF